MKHINAKWEKIKEQKKEGEEESQSVLESLLLTTKNPKIPVVMATDIFFAGIDTVGRSLNSYFEYFPY